MVARILRATIVSISTVFGPHLCCPYIFSLGTVQLLDSARLVRSWDTAWPTVGNHPSLHAQKYLLTMIIGIPPLALFRSVHPARLQFLVLSFPVVIVLLGLLFFLRAKILGEIPALKILHIRATETAHFRIRLLISRATR